MSTFPCLARFVSGSGQVRYRLGDRLVDRYLEFVAGRCRPDALRAVAFDLKAFFTVVAKDPVGVIAAGVFEFLADQRGDRTVVRLADGESGLSARTIARRLSSVSGLYAYLVARGDTPVRFTCAYFRTGTEFPPILIRQRDHARDHGQTDRTALSDGLSHRAETGLATPERS
jgi:Phage integrase, N-terminal SAM-like domain